MSILNYGLFWRREAVEWHPGVGGDFRLMGRQGQNKNTLQVANFREQCGIYILYGNYGVFYVGIVTSGGLGNRLRQHHDSHTEAEWARFSWFGFRRVRKYKEGGIRVLAEMPQVRATDPIDSIKDLESLLIRAMGPSGQRVETFTVEERWEQVGEDEIADCLKKLGVEE